MFVCNIERNASCSDSDLLPVDAKYSSGKYILYEVYRNYKRISLMDSVGHASCTCHNKLFLLSFSFMNKFFLYKTREFVRYYTVGEQKHFCHLERSYLLLLCGIGYNVVKWSLCEFKRDLLYFFNICNNIIL